MKHSSRTLVLGAALTVLAGSTVAWAQDTTYKPEKDKPSENPTRQPATPAATPRDDTQASHPVRLIPAEWAIGRSVYGTADEKIGEVNDLIISRPDGRIQYGLIGQGGVLGIGEKVIAVPYSAFGWNPQKKSMTLPISADRLKGAPALEPGDWKTLNESSRLDTMYSYFGLTRETGPNADDRLYRDAYRSTLNATDMPLLRVTDIKGKTLMGDDGREIGKVDDLVFDSYTGRIAFVAVTFGGVMGIGADRVAVPWTAFDVNKEGRLFASKLDKEMVRSAPRLKESEWGELQESGYAPRVYKHYNLKAPWFDRNTSGRIGEDKPGALPNDYSRLYTSGTERKVSGTILTVDEMSPKPGVGEICSCTLKTSGAEGDPTIVHLAPRTYLDQNGMTLKPGDTVTVRGRWVRDGDKQYLIANEIIPASGKSLSVRNSDGSTPWP